MGVIFMHPAYVGWSEKNTFSASGIVPCVLLEVDVQNGFRWVEVTQESFVYWEKFVFLTNND